MADEAKRIHVSPGVGARVSMARPRSKSHRPFIGTRGPADERASSGGAPASEANAPVRECGAKYQVSWDVTRDEDEGATMGATKVKAALLCGALVVSVMLQGCEAVEGALGQTVVLTTADDYLSEMRSSQLPMVSAEATKHEGVLTVGLRDAQASPLVIVADGTDAAGHSVEGVDVDVARAVADELGLRVQFSCIADVAAALGSDCDVVMGVNPLESNGFDVVGNYEQTATALFRSGTDATQATADEVRAARIAVQAGSAAGQALQRLGLEQNEVVRESLMDAFEALSSGEADFVACSSAAGGYLASMRGGIVCAGTLEPPTAYGIAVSNGNTELTAALAEALMRMERNGAISETRRIWLGTADTLDDGAQIQGIASAPQPAPTDATTPAEGDAQPAPEAAQSPDAPPDGTSTETEVIAGANAATL